MSRWPTRSRAHRPWSWSPTRASGAAATRSGSPPPTGLLTPDKTRTASNERRECALASTGLIIESVFAELKDQMRLEQPFARTSAGLAVRIAQRILVLTLRMLLNTTPHAVELAVAAAVEPVALLFAGARVERGNVGVAGELCIASEAVDRVVRLHSVSACKSG
jgi:hypothetical protein